MRKGLRPLYLTMYLLMVLSGLALLFFVVPGCAKVQFNRDTGELNYSRFGNQKLKGFEMEISPDGSMAVKLNAQEGNAGDLAEMGKNMSEATLKILTLIP